jgi:hypothetical protein
MQLFRDRLRAEQGVFRRVRLWMDVIADLAVSILREYRRPNRVELILEPDRVRQNQPGRELILLRSEIVKINESRHRLLIIGVRAGRPGVIEIRARLADYPKIREHISHWMPIRQRRELWLTDPRPVLGSMVALLPAILLIRR